MIEVKVIDLLNAEEILTKIKKDAEANGLNFNLSFKMKKLLDKLAPEFTDIYEQRTKIFNKFGQEQDVEGEKNFRIPAEKVEIFNKYWEELLNTNIEVFNVFKFKVEELNLSAKYTLDEVHFLSPFIEDVAFEKEPERSKINIKFDDEGEDVEASNEEQTPDSQEN